MEKYGVGSIVVADYDPNWPTLFKQERTRIKNALGSFALAIIAIACTNRDVDYWHFSDMARCPK
jgi:GrpB-like predicted nucleotidyltransferase (UPF0157 family)